MPGGRPRVRSVAVLFAGLIGAAAALAVVGAAYLTFRAAAQTAAAERRAAVVLDVYDAVARQAAAFDSVVREIRTIVTARHVTPTRSHSIHERIGRDPDPLFAPSLAEVPAAMRQALARTEREFGALATKVAETLALAELGRWENARGRFAEAESLHLRTGEWVGQAQRLGLEDLVQRHRELLERERVTSRFLLLWAAGGALLLAALAWVLHTRIRRPLERLDSAFRRIADGDLTASVPVEHHDEIGRVSEHFNAMTAVLRQRAAEQGRFSAAGELLVGVAHEVNNPLMAISALAEDRLSQDDLSTEQRRDLQEMLQQARRAGTLLAGLLRFVRPSRREPRPIAVNEVLESAIDLVSYQFGVDEITLKKDLAPDLPRVVIDPTSLEQVLVNLLSNATDAVRAAAPPRRIRVASFAADGRVAVSVEDNGPGVPEEVLPELFAPFATTKGRRGSGLGLYVARQIVREAGGDVQHGTSSLGGARFTITLPAKEREPEGAASPAPPASAKRPLAGITILCVDDEEVVRRAIAKFLARRGAEVVQARNGLDALTALERYGVDAVITDLRMPRMGGVDFYRKLEVAHPGLAPRVLFLSGDLEELHDAAPGLPPERVVPKPVELLTLERQVLRIARPEAPAPPRGVRREER